jgi:hypothetical protein
LKPCTSFVIAVFSALPHHPPFAVHAHLQWGLGCLLGRSPLQQQGPRQQSTVQERLANKDRKRRSRKAREGNPPSKGIDWLISQQCWLIPDEQITCPSWECELRYSTTVDVSPNDTYAAYLRYMLEHTIKRYRCINNKHRTNRCHLLWCLEHQYDHMQFSRHFFFKNK